MDIYTKIFLANWVLFIAITSIDSMVLEDKIELHLSIPLSIWANACVLSIPLWLIYLIVTW